MSQSTLIVGALFVLFVIYITAKGELPAYLKVFGLGGNSSAAGGTPVTIPGVIGGVTTGANLIHTASSVIGDFTGSNGSNTTAGSDSGAVVDFAGLAAKLKANP